MDENSAKSLNYNDAINCLKYISSNHKVQITDNEVFIDESKSDFGESEISLEEFYALAAELGLHCTLGGTVVLADSPFISQLYICDNNKLYVVISNTNDQIKLYDGATGQHFDLSLREFQSQVCCCINITHKDSNYSIRKFIKKEWIIKGIQSNKGKIIEVFIASFMINIFALAIPLYAMKVYDRVIPNHGYDTLFALTVGVLIILSFDFLMRVLKDQFIDETAKKIDIDVSSRLYSKLLTINLNSESKTISAVNNAMNNFENFRGFLATIPINLFIELPFAVLFLIIIGVINFYVMLAPLFACVLILIVNMLTELIIRSGAVGGVSSGSGKSNLLIETLYGLDSIKANRASKLFQERWENNNNQLIKTKKSLRSFINLSLSFSHFFTCIAVVFTVAIGAYQVTLSQLSIGELIACVILTNKIFQPIMQLVPIYSRFKNLNKSVEIIDEVLRLGEDQERGSGLISLSKKNNSVEFRDVGFMFHDSRQVVLSKVNLTIEPGERVALLGEVSSGKSTFARLLLKLIAPSQGNIFLDKVNFQQIKDDDLHKLIGYVAEEPFLFNGTILENILLGSGDNIKKSQFDALCTLCSIDKITEKYKFGIQHVVGDRGELLSKGERRLVVLARALINNPDIYVLDDPMIGVDSVAINTFVDGFKSVLENKTALIISQNPKILSLCNRAVVLKRGMLVDADINEITGGQHELSPKVH